MFDSVRTRLTLWYVCVLALVLLAFSIGIYSLLARSLNERLDSGLRATLGSMALSLRRELADAETEEVGTDEDEVEAKEISTEEIAFSAIEDLPLANQAIAIFDSQEQLLSEKSGPDNLHASLPSLDTIPDKSINIFTLPGNQTNDNGLRVAVQRLNATTKSTTYLLVVAQSLRANAEELRLLRRIFYLVVPIALVLAGLGGFFLAHMSLAPVVTMSERARRISAENLDVRLPVANPRDELGRLAATFNELLARLNASFDRQRQFMADASHELRTPLSVMHTTAEVTLEHPRRTESEYRDALAMMDTQVRRLTRIVEDMFTLARADAGRLELHQSDFYLDELISETAQAARVLAARKDVSMEVAVAADVPFRGDEELLRQMMLNLLDNAIRYTPAGGKVRVSLAQDGSDCEIIVADSGTGISAEAQPQIFERFYREDEARSHVEAANGGSGAGLGLSIARWIAESHNGRLELRHTDENGSIFVASLPTNPL